MSKRGTFIMVDGIDGSGKGTIVKELCRIARKDKLRVFDLVAYEKKYHTLPEPSELKKYDVIRSAEPTHSLIGLAIRNEIIRNNGRAYSGSAVAQAYALDRFMLYQRVLIPALTAGKMVIQERGVSTSLCYQPIQRNPVALAEILKLEGNKLALKWKPTDLVIVSVDPRVAMKRLSKRIGKQDKAVFEKVDFLEKAQRRFLSKDFISLFSRQGTTVHALESSGTVQTTRKAALELWREIVA